MPGAAQITVKSTQPQQLFSSTAQVLGIELTLPSVRFFKKVSYNEGLRSNFDNKTPNFV